MHRQTPDPPDPHGGIEQGVEASTPEVARNAGKIPAGMYSRGFWWTHVGGLGDRADTKTLRVRVLVSTRGTEMTYAAMNKGFTVFEELGSGKVSIHSADTIIQAAALMARTFTDPMHRVDFRIVESAPVPVEKQIKNRLAKLAKIAKLAGRNVTRFHRDGVIVTAFVAR